MLISAKHIVIASIAETHRIDVICFQENHVNSDFRDRTGTVAGIVPARNNIGPVTEHFLFQRRNMLSIFSVLSEIARCAK